MENIRRQLFDLWAKSCYITAMDETRSALAANLAELRKNENLTQAEFAERLNYSDKAVSKWERGESLPDVVMLKTIADMYGVTVDDLLTENGLPGVEKKSPVRDEQTTQKILVASLWITMVWIVAAMVFMYSKISMGKAYWMAFLWAVPLSCAVACVFTIHWQGRGKLLCVFSSLFVWATIIAFYFQYLDYNIWMIFFVGLPVQIALIIGARIRPGPRWRMR